MQNWGSAVYIILTNMALKPMTISYNMTFALTIKTCFAQVQLVTKNDLTSKSNDSN